MIAVRAAFFALLVASPLGAQSVTPAAVTDSVAVWPGFPANVIAVSYCVFGGQRSLIDVRLLGTDSLPEILAHEATHREQFSRLDAPCGGRTTLEVFLNAEVGAWCATRALRMARRGISKADADQEILQRLYATFSPTLPPTLIAMRYAERCA